MKSQLKKVLAVISCSALIASSMAAALTVSAYDDVYAKTTADLNLRKGAGTNYSVVKVIDQNTTLNVVEASNSNWLKVKLSDGTTGYCFADYLDITTDAVTTAALNVRSGAGTNYNIITTIPQNTKIDVIRFSGTSWAYVKLQNGTTGYVYTDCIQFVSSSNTSVTTTSANITLSAASQKIAVGKSLTLKASSNQGTVTWTTSNNKVAKVDSNGKVTAISAGQAVITATDSKTKKTAKCTITTVKTEYTSITLSDTSKSLIVGNTYTLTFSTNTGSKNVKFKSSNTNVATVDANGKITAVSAGDANIIAYDSTSLISAVCKVSVNNKDSISLSQSNANVNVGSSVLLTAKKSNSSMQIKWSSSNNNVASVNNGRVSGLSSGTAVITASDSTGKIFARCNVKVNAVSSGNVRLSRYTASTSAGKTIYIKGYNASYWGTTDTNIATVRDGFIETKNPGKVAVTYTDKYGNTAVCVVTVTEAEPVRFAYSSPNSATLNQNVTLVAITDKTVEGVYFNVTMGSKILKVNATKKTADGNTYVWEGAFKTSQAGTFKTTAYAKKNNQWKTCDDAVSDVYVTSKTSHTQTGLEKLRASDGLIKFIAEKEGFVSNITYDTLANNIPTIAHGYVVWEGEKFYDHLTKNEGYALLVNAVNNDVYTSKVNQMLLNNNVRFNQQQFDALVSFSYNLGTGWTNSSNLKNILLNSYGTVQTGKMTGKVTASSGLYLRQSPSSSASVITLLKSGETVEIVDNNKYNTVWYKVKTSSGQTGYCSSTYLNVTSSGGSQTGRDLNYVNRNALINEMLAYHHAGGVCYYGLLYRRADELEMFLYGDYTSDGRRNKYGFPNPSCISW